MCGGGVCSGGSDGSGMGCLGSVGGEEGVGDGGANGSGATGGHDGGARGGDNGGGAL